MGEKMRSFFRSEWLYLAVCVIHTGAFLAVYPKVPQTVPNSIGFHGQIQSYADKSVLLLLAAIPWLVYILMLVAPYIDPRKQNYQRFPGIYSLIRGILLLFLVALCWVMIWLGFEPEIHGAVPNVIMGAISLMMVAMGNYMPSVKQNYYLGIRTPWTLHSEENWNRTHRVGGPLMMLGGGVGLVCALMSKPVWGLVAVIIGALLPCVYSFWLFRKGI